MNDLESLMTLIAILIGGGLFFLVTRGFESLSDSRRRTLHYMKGKDCVDESDCKCKPVFMPTTNMYEHRPNK